MTAKQYDCSPETNEVSAGTKIIFTITAEDREHGFQIKDTEQGRVKIKKGETVTVEYLAEKPGTVEFKCCVFCDMGHSGTKGKIVIR